MLQEKKSSTSTRKIIKATQENYEQLNNFLNQNNQIHRHLDWFTPLDWLGHQPYLIEFIGDSIQAVLCATPENDDSAWVRTFSAKKLMQVEETWLRLLPRATQMLADKGIARLASLALHTWFEALLVDSGFKNRQNIVVLEWQGKLPPNRTRNPEVEIRAMNINDLKDVERIDRLAFPSLWQNSLAGLTKAFQQTGVSTVALSHGKIVGYQISTSMTIYSHLARLAVDPAYQRQGIAFLLVNDLLKQCVNQSCWRVTVNTQSDNTSSLKLYDKFGFKRTREEIPVFELLL